MLDEPLLRERLVSKTFGALAQITTLSALALAADIAAVRLFGDGSPTTGMTARAPGSRGHAGVRAFVMHAPLRLPAAWDVALQEWPFSQESIFEFVARRNIRDCAFRVRELLGEQEFSGKRFFHVFEPHAAIIDSYCVTFPVHGPLWAMLLLLRATPSAAFTPGDAALLQRLKPVMAASLRDTMKDHASPQINSRWNGSSAGPTPRGGAPDADSAGRQSGDRVLSPADAARRLAALSQTEKQVCKLLRDHITEAEVARTLGRSPHTIHVHVKNIYRKLSVNSRRDLVRLLAQ